MKVGDPRRRALLEYFVRCRDLMRLQAWDLYIAEDLDESADPSILTINPDIRNMWAKIKVGTFFDDDPVSAMTPEEQRTAICHELLHLVHAELWHWLHRREWKKPLAPDVAEHIEAEVVHQTEVLVGFASRFAAELLPLPPAWPDA